MQTQVAQNNALENSSANATLDLLPVGTIVAYGLQGLCTIQAVETRSAGGQTLNLYKLEKLKSPLSRSQKSEGSIWVPVRDARTKGLRTPASEKDVEMAFELLANEEVFFPLDANWSDVQPALESSIRADGFAGLCKVFSYLNLLERRKIRLNTETARFLETVSRHFYRELGQATNEGVRELETRVAKALRQKISATH